MAKDPKNKETARDKETDEARKWLRKSLERWGAQDIKIADTYFVYAYPRDNTRGGFNLNLIQSTELTREEGTGWFGWRVRIFNYGEGRDDRARWIQFVNQNDAEMFQRAVNFLSDQCQRDTDVKNAADFEQFKEKAKAWHAQAEKPALPEEARQHKVLAENAYREKDFDKMISEYEVALKVFPCWPEGQFNLAFVCGEQKYYRTAILHMKCYLELVPNGPDAQAARDKIIIWQDKIRR